MQNTAQKANGNTFLEMQAESKLASYYKQNTILQDQIFDILQQNCRVLYYPLEDETIGGCFTHLQGETFVIINTSLTYEEQILIAAHALYHVWYGRREGILPTTSIERPNQELSPDEQQADQFARALLLPELLLVKEMHLHAIQIKLQDLADILKLARIFLVPFHTMVKRLREIEAISQSTYLSFVELDKNHLEMWKKRLGLESLERTNTISLDRLVEYTVRAYEQHQITFERLEYLLSLSGLQAGQVGITSPEQPQIPSDEELSSLMEI